MTNPIPQAAVDAACDAYHRPGRMITNTAVGAHHDRMTAALEAAIPHLRKQIADEIRAADLDSATFNQTARDYSVDYANGYATAIEHAARIAEGDQK